MRTDSIYSNHVVMALVRKEVEGFDNFLSLAENVKKEGNKVYALFKGNIDPVSGISWCSDCVKGE